MVDCLVWLTLHAQHSSNRTQVKLPGQKSSLLMQQLGINVFPASGMSVHMAGDQYSTSKSNTNLANTFFVDAQVLYQFKKYKTEISIEGTNLTGNNDYTTVSVNGNSSRQLNFPLRPCTVMGTVRVRF